MVQFELSGELAGHLLELFSKLPRSAMIPGASLSQKFEASGRRIALLPQRTQVLALCVLAISARLSPHPLLFGPGPSPPKIATLFEPQSVDRLQVAEWGRKRQNACQRLREIAVERAWNARLLAGQAEDENGNVDEEALAACQLLYAIEAGYELSAGYPWRAAFISILRKKLEMQRHAKIAASRSSTNMGSGFSGSIPGGSELGWTTHVMRETLASAALEQISPFTMYDEELVCGPRPVSPEKILEHADTFGIADSFPPRSSYEGETTRTEWWDLASMLCLFRPFTYRISELAIASYDFSLQRTHGKPFDFSKLESYLSSLAPLQKIVEIANERMKALLSPPAVVIRRQMGRGSAFSMVTGEKPGEINELFRGEPDTAEGGLKGTINIEGTHSPVDEFRVQISARSFFALIHGAMGAILIPVYVDIQERLYAFEEGNGCASDDLIALRALRDVFRKALLPHAQVLLRDIRTSLHVAWMANLTRSIAASTAPSSHTSTDDGSVPSSFSKSTPSTGSSPASSDSSHSSTHSGIPSLNTPRGKSSRAIPSMSAVGPLGWEAQMLQYLYSLIFPRVASREYGSNSLAFWATVILDSPAIEDGGFGMTREQKAAELECILNVSRILSWCNPTSFSETLAGLIERNILILRAGRSSDSPSLASDGLATPSTSSHSSSTHAHTPSAATSSIPSPKEIVEGIRHERVADVYFGGDGKRDQGTANIEDIPDVIGELCRDLSCLSFAAATAPNIHWEESSPGFRTSEDVSALSSDGLSNPHLNMLQAQPNFDLAATDIHASLAHDQTTFSLGTEADSVVQMHQNPSLESSGWMSWNFGGDGDTYGQTYQGQLQAPDSFSSSGLPIHSSISPLSSHSSLLSPPQVDYTRGASPVSAASLQPTPPSASELEHEFQQMFGVATCAAQTGAPSFQDLLASTGDETGWFEADGSGWGQDM
ncbi:hypothetical protein CONPUDRAFT_137699 [Coniophora puteana RWD-64-598 SS2]|uniref:Transcription factor domain-containing protein n=1 Tax=Coniophora puteana (strain RWD-64-598) TaxID=741705 RepID=A0A5M3MMW9_CONPW|nr:uncharacterized protein CONPUDRAFT_137699 [Coniophora puteana RWD-64-598 SS2]EIW80529.1 hypothetical protein CONPUDRAFT_137699 [Coniophora puteana RWD-64-598 SS2]